MLETLLDLAVRDLGQGHEVPRPRQGHACAGRACDLGSPLRVCEAGVTPFVERGQTGQADVGDRQGLAGAGGLEHVSSLFEMLAREVGTQKLPVTATELNASSRCFQWKPGCVEVGNALLEQSLGRRRFGVVPVGIAGSTQQAPALRPFVPRQIGADGKQSEPVESIESVPDTVEPEHNGRREPLQGTRFNCPEPGGLREWHGESV